MERRSEDRLIVRFTVKKPEDYFKARIANEISSWRT